MPNKIKFVKMTFCFALMMFFWSPTLVASSLQCQEIFNKDTFNIEDPKLNFPSDFYKKQNSFYLLSEWWNKLTAKPDPYFLHIYNKSRDFRRLIESHPDLKKVLKFFTSQRIQPTVMSTSELQDLLSPREQEVIKDYTLDGYKSINRALLKGQCEKNCIELYNAIQKISPYVGMVVRMGNLGYYQDFVKDSGNVRSKIFFSSSRFAEDSAYNRIAYLFDQGVGSTTQTVSSMWPNTQKTNKKIIMFIKTRTGRSIENLSSLPRAESEVLLFPGTVFKIVAKPIIDSSGNTIVFLEEIAVEAI